MLVPISSTLHGGPAQVGFAFRQTCARIAAIVVERTQVVQGRMWSFIVVGAVRGQERACFVQRCIFGERKFLAQGTMEALVGAIRLRMMRPCAHVMQVAV